MTSHAKRIDIVSLRMIKESSVLYAARKIGTPKDVVNLVREFLEDADREQMIVCCVNQKNEPTSISVVSVGTLNSSLIHPREIFKTAIMSNAASIFLAHNHPSGDPNPSKEDIDITHNLKEAGEILRIKVLDHVIIGDNARYTSFKEKGLL